MLCTDFSYTVREREGLWALPRGREIGKVVREWRTLSKRIQGAESQQEEGRAVERVGGVWVFHWRQGRGGSGKGLQHFRGMVEGHPCQSPVRRESFLLKGLVNFWMFLSTVNVMTKFVFFRRLALVALRK